MISSAEKESVFRTFAGFCSKHKVLIPKKFRLISKTDSLLVEEPLEIRINNKQFAITMRTPGDDIQLVAGLFFTEGLVKSIDDILKIEYCGREKNTINVVFKGNKKPIKRKFITSSSCGICGREIIEMISKDSVRLQPVTIRRDLIAQLPVKMKKFQKFFQATGGSHAAVLFTIGGKFVMCKEDVGRHNAVDKLIGQALIDDLGSLDKFILVVSGRLSFEIVQKGYMGKIPVVCSVSAASTLAIEFAKKTGVTAIGMIRGNNFNVYNLNGTIV